MRVACGVLLIVLALLQYRLWAGDSSIPDVYRLRHQVSVQTVENQHLSARNQAMEAEVASLKQGNDAIEGRARSELGMIRDNETFYLIVHH